jgi:hypothetical protein
MAFNKTVPVCVGCCLFLTRWLTYLKTALMRLAFLLLITSLVVRAQQGYDVKFQVENFADSTVYLGYYFGDNTYVKDTARAGSDGRFTFSGAKQLPEGIYLLIVNRTNQLEFVIGRDQHFVVKSKGPEYVNNITIVGEQCCLRRRISTQNY